MPVNLLAVVGAAVVNMVIGAFWYSPKVFGNSWMALIGKRQEELRSGMGQAYGVTFLAALLLAYILARFVAVAEAKTILQGAQIGFLVWLGFVVTTSSGDYLFAGRPPRLYLINMAYQGVSLIVLGALLAAWR